MRSALRSLVSVVTAAGGVVMVAGLWLMPTADALQGAPSGKASDPRVEDIYIARSMRGSRLTTATAFCAETRTGFGDAAFEDRYTFHSTATRGSDGLITDTNVATIGRLHACLGSQANPLYGFYAEGSLGAVTFTGRGECRTVNSDFPEAGMAVIRCFLELSNLPAGYIGGQLTTNTMGSRNVLGPETDPPGYTQPSIATIRLWKRR